VGGSTKPALRSRTVFYGDFGKSCDDKRTSAAGGTLISASDGKRIISQLSF
jgi:hypothetical protein